MGFSLFLDKFTCSFTNVKKSSKNAIALNLANGEVPSNEELWLIGEIWRIGRGSNFTIVTKSASNTNIPLNSLQIQVKSNSGRVRVKNGREVEEFSLEEFPVKLEATELNFDRDQISVISDSQEDPDHDESTVSESNVPVHYVLTNQKSERTNPILREKAMKALKLVTSATTKSIEIIIHELPHEIMGKLLYDPAALNKNLKMNEEQREQVKRINQFVSVVKKTISLSGGKVMVLYNHRDNQTDLLYIK